MRGGVRGEQLCVDLQLGAQTCQPEVRHRVAQILDEVGLQQRPTRSLAQQAL